MGSSLVRGVLAGAIALAIAQPAWAATESKPVPAKEEKAEKKVVAKESAEIKKVQEALKAKGQDPGAIDGIMGKKTRAAIKAFQEANSLKATGKLDQQTAEKLGVEMVKVAAKTATEK